MDLLVTALAGSTEGRLVGGDFACPVVLGKNGVISATHKREGDGCTPLGRYKILYGCYRPDRVHAPLHNGLPWLPLTPNLGWCDAPEDAAYNTIVPVGYGVSHEALWREDSAYDRLLVIGHNLPAVPHMGSAVFIHQLHPGKAYTAGCVALAADDFTAMLALGPTFLTIA